MSHMTRRRIWLILATCLAFGAACSPTEDTSQSSSATTRAAAVTATTVATTPTTAVPVPVVGEAITSALGTMTVYSVDYPIVGTESALRIKDPDTDFAVADIQICPTSTLDASPTDFQIQTTDNRTWTFWNVQIGVREPNLTQVLFADIAAGTCVRGWLTFQIGAGATPKTVIYAPSSGRPPRWSAV